MPQRIAYLDGRRLARAIAEGARAVAAGREPLDRINVYPVPDGDTGSNLVATLERVASRLSGSPSGSAAQVARAAADEALTSARGNSGAIFAQFLEGLAEGLRGTDRVTPREFGPAALAASESARGAMAHPQEGTILSVIREWARRVEERSRVTADFAELMPDALAAALDALERTPEQLPVLKKAGVVDAGAQGFVMFLEGVGRSLGRRTEAAERAPMGAVVEARIQEVRESILFRYCTEVLIVGERIDRDGLRRAVGPLGDSIAVVGSASRVRLHIHVNRPDDVFEAARDFGRVETTKVDDMRVQSDTARLRSLSRLARPGRVAVVTDSACDLPERELEESGITVVPLRLYLGDEVHLDKVTITVAEFQRRLAAGGAHPRTSQPPPADFREVYRMLASHSSPVAGIHVSGALSGTLNAARSAAASLAGEPHLAPVATVDSRCVSIGQGLVVREAVRVAAAGRPLAEVVEAAEAAAARVRVFVALPSLDSLIRGGRVGAARGAVARMLGLLPLLTLDRQGRAVRAGLARSFPAACRKLVARSLALTRSLPSPMFGIAHVSSPELADAVARELLAGHPGAGHFVVEVSPALAAHAGPGAVAVAFLAA